MAPLQSWLRDKMRWLLLFSVSAFKCLLEPHPSFASGTSGFELRGVYAGALHGARSDALAGVLYRDTEIRQLVGSSEMAWLRLSFTCGGSEVPPKISSSFPSILLQEASLEATPELQDYDKAMKDAFLASYDVPDVASLLSAVRGSSLAVACIADAFCIGKFSVDVAPPSDADMQVARNHRYVMTALILKSQAEDLSSLAKSASSPAGAAARVGSWLSGVLLSSAMLAVPGWRDLEQISHRARYLLSLELSRFPAIVPEAVVLEVARHKSGSALIEAKAAVRESIVQSLNELGSLYCRCLPAWRDNSNGSHGVAARSLEILLGSAESRPLGLRNMNGGGRCTQCSSSSSWW